MPWYDIIWNDEPGGNVDHIAEHGLTRGTTVTNEIRKRIVRVATPEEKERHRAIRQEIQKDLPELEQWARDTAARHRERVVVGTVFTDQEATVLDAIDDYAAKHSLPNRGAVVREALAHLLGIEVHRH